MVPDCGQWWEAKVSRYYIGVWGPSYPLSTGHWGHGLHLCLGMPQGMIQLGRLSWYSVS